MDHLYSNSYSLVTFKHIYDLNIKPKLELIDVFFKTEESPYTPEQISILLQIPLDELHTIMTTYHVETLTKLTTFTVIMNASSHICQLINRQWRFMDRDYYTPAIISFIYELNEAKVHNAFNRLGKEIVSDRELSDVFDLIPVPIFKL